MIRLLGDHLWQSTLVAALAALLTFALRRNRAQVRYWVWLAASIKFWIPFAALVAAGRQLGLITMPRTVILFDATLPSGVTLMADVSRPFSRPELATALTTTSATTSSESLVPAFLIAVWILGFMLMLRFWCLEWRRIALIVRAGTPLKSGREVEALRRLETRARIHRPIDVVATDAAIEPGIFGILRPVLLWPRAIGERLADAHVEAILKHELAHVARRDNLAAAFHAIVQAVFWFHPLVWWIGRRLVDERERACDEHVVGVGIEPDVYAASILKTCAFCLEAPAACLAGVTGSNLKQRIEDIMKNQRRARLNPAKKFLLAAAAAASLAVPVAVGVATAPRVFAQAALAQASKPTFEVASIKPNKSGDGRILIGRPAPDRLTVTNMPLREIVRIAYQVQQFQISGGPEWIGSERFDVTAKAERPFSAADGWLMLRALLEERFKLAVHTETKEMPIYALVLARSDGRLGEKLRRSGPDCAPQRLPAGFPAPPPPSPGGAAAFTRGLGNDSNGPPRCPTMFGPGFISARSATMEQLTRGLAPQVRRVVIDRTGLTGEFDVDVEFTPEFRPPAPPGAPDIAIPADGPSIFTALQEQLGLKLESDRGPVEMIVIDRAEPLIPD